MIRFATLSSGSSGNCTAVWNEEGLVLIDMGTSCRKTVSTLNELGFSASDVSAVLITHEHVDHISGIRVFAKHYPTCFYGTRSTKRYLEDSSIIGPSQDFREFEKGISFEAGGFRIIPFATNHDSRTCSGFRLEREGRAVALATDIGSVDDGVRQYLSGCGIVGIEANYDEIMLRTGPYAPSLQARIKSPFGHLSNSDCAAEVARLIDEEGVRNIVLMHISDKNNTPEMAMVACIGAAEDRGIPEDSYRLIAAPRYGVSEILELD
ncbi:MAG: MBL fold metallo-hydrolase [Oscillospiraceae bacterium]|nr:MBL fold metallo-hydrolase [Oscillospiraceae bacterium]